MLNYGIRTAMIPIVIQIETFFSIAIYYYVDSGQFILFNKQNKETKFATMIYLSAFKHDICLHLLKKRAHCEKPFKS